MSTSEPAQADARIRPDVPDDPTIWEVDDALWARLALLLHRLADDGGQTS